MSEARLRPCAAVCLFHPDGRVFVARRIDQPPDAPFAWQLPQGGIDAGEAPEMAARRELFEETGIGSVRLLGELPEWLSYTYPAGTGRGSWSGQTQRWFAYLFTGDESEIEILDPPDHSAEFDEWRWEELAAIPALAIPFKRPVYEAVAAGFAPIAAELAGDGGQARS